MLQTRPTNVYMPAASNPGFVADDRSYGCIDPAEIQRGASNLKKTEDQVTKLSHDSDSSPSMYGDNVNNDQRHPNYDR